MTVTLAGVIAHAQPAPGGQPEPRAQGSDTATPTAPPADAALPHDAPPPPPLPGAAGDLPPPPPPVGPVFPAEGSAATREEAPPIAGFHRGVFYIREPKDYFRFYARMRAHLDLHAFFGPGVSEVKAPDGGNALKTEFFLRRLRFEFGGEAFKRWSFLGGVDFRQSISNANGKSETAAARAGDTPTSDSARFASVQSTTPSAEVANVYINYSVAPWLNFMFGQHQMPFSMENRTSNRTISFMERNVAIRGFLTPLSKEMGLFVWGAGKVFNYEFGVFAGDGQNRPQIDNNVDFIGRAWTTPLAGRKGPLSKLQIGMSARHGDRDPKYVGYDYASIRSNNGYSLWEPRYKDSQGRQVHVLPSGGQNAIGGELRIYAGAGHSLHWEEPQRFAQDLAKLVHQIETLGKAPTRTMSQHRR